ncbi:MAG: hypothetical protein ABW127_00115 [Candidatus Thiodiazotropha endolucinida]
MKRHILKIQKQFLATTLTMSILSFLFFGSTHAQETNHFEEIQFEQVPFTNESLEKYPFLQNSDEFVLQVKKESVETRRPVKEYVAVMHDDRLENPVTFVYEEGSSACGTHGCRLSGYEILDDGSYRRLKIYLVTNRPIYKFVCDTDLFLITTGGGGSSRGNGKWLFADDGVKHIRTFQKLSDAVACGNKPE